jgi:hypothetical protein
LNHPRLLTDRAQGAKRKANTPLKNERKSRPQPLAEIDVNAIQNAQRSLKPVARMPQEPVEQIRSGVC